MAPLATFLMAWQLGGNSRKPWWPLLLRLLLDFGGLSPLRQRWFSSGIAPSKISFKNSTKNLHFFLHLVWGAVQLSRNDRKRREAEPNSTKPCPGPGVRHDLPRGNEPSAGGRGGSRQRALDGHKKWTAFGQEARPENETLLCRNWPKTVTTFWTQMRPKAFQTAAL